MADIGWDHIRDRKNKKEKMSWIKRQIDIFGLWRVWKYQKPINLPNANLEYIMRAVKKDGNLDKTRRNLIASIIKKARSAHPYQPEDYSQAKKEYDEYFAMDGHITDIQEVKDKMKVGNIPIDVYIVRFSDRMPVKTKRYGAYYVNTGLGPPHVTYKCGKVVYYRDRKRSDEVEWINLDGLDHNQRDGLDNDSFTGFRYATKDEIENYKRRKTKIESLQAVVSHLQKEKERVYENISTIRDEEIDGLKNESERSKKMG